MPLLLIATWRELVARPVLKGSAGLLSMFCNASAFRACFRKAMMLIPSDRHHGRPGCRLNLSCEFTCERAFCSRALSQLVAAGSSEEHAIPEGGRPQLDKGLFCMIRARNRRAASLDSPSSSPLLTARTIVSTRYPILLQSPIPILYTSRFFVIMKRP